MGLLQAGLKTGMYYLRTRAAADAIKFTVDQQALAKNKAARAAAAPKGMAATAAAEPLKVTWGAPDSAVLMLQTTMPVLFWFWFILEFSEVHWMLVCTVNPRLPCKDSVYIVCQSGAAMWHLLICLFASGLALSSRILATCMLSPQHKAREG